MEEPLWRSLLLDVWEIWEKMFGLANHIEDIRPGGLFRLNTHRYHGPRVELSDGTTVRAGDLVGELHLSNRSTHRLLLKHSSRVRATMAVKKELKLDLSYLASVVAANPNASDIKAYYGITLLHHGTQSMGFEIRELQANRVLHWLLRIGQHLLLYLYHPAGAHRFEQGHQKLVTKYIWISRAKLLRQYLPAGR